MSNPESLAVFVVMTNKDLTEGKGGDEPLMLCETATTAARLGKGRYVQGSDCPVIEVPAVKLNGEWWLPVRRIPIERASTEDLAFEHQQAVDAARARAKAAALRKAQAAGLSDDDIAALIGY